MATPARCAGSYAIQVIQHHNEKQHAYKVSGIQMHHVFLSSVLTSRRGHVTWSLPRRPLLDWQVRHFLWLRAASEGRRTTSTEYYSFAGHRSINAETVHLTRDARVTYTAKNWTGPWFYFLLYICITACLKKIHGVRYTVQMEEEEIKRRERQIKESDMEGWMSMGVLETCFKPGALTAGFKGRGEGWASDWSQVSASCSHPPPTHTAQCLLSDFSWFIFSVLSQLNVSGQQINLQTAKQHHAKQVELRLVSSKYLASINSMMVFII